MEFMEYEALVQTIVVHLLVSIRILGLMSANPLFSAPGWPIPVRFWVAVMLSVIVVPNAGLELPEFLMSQWVFIIIIFIREFVIGLAIGFFCALPLYVMQMSGFFEGNMMGLAMATMIDPMSQNQVALIGQIKYLVAVWFLFHWNGHLLLVQGVASSLSLIPIAQGSWGGGALIPWSNWLQQAYIITMTISLPVMGSLLLADIGLGFVARTVPQMNVFVIGIPLKIGLGLFLILSVLPLTIDVIHALVEKALVMAMEGAYLWK